MQVVSLRIKERKKLREFCKHSHKSEREEVQKFNQKDYKTSKYAYVISRRQVLLFQMNKTINDSLDVTDRLWGICPVLKVLVT